MTVTSPPARGTVERVGSGWVYRVAPGGLPASEVTPGRLVDSFTYTVSDGNGFTDTATVRLRLPNYFNLAGGLAREDFTDDLNPPRPGMDSFDADPDTAGADGLRIRNDLPAPTMSTEEWISSQVPGGGYYIVGRPSAGEPPLSPNQGENRLLLSGGQVTFSFPPPGTPGGTRFDQEVTLVGLRLFGTGTLEVEGEGGTATIPFEVTGEYDALLISSIRVLPDGGNLGAIKRVTVNATGGQVLIENVTASATALAPPAGTDPLVRTIDSYGLPTPIVMTTQGSWNRNDRFDAHFAIQVLEWPEHGRIHKKDLRRGGGSLGGDAWSEGVPSNVFLPGSWTYLPDPGFVGTDTFTYQEVAVLHDESEFMLVIDPATPLFPVLIPRPAGPGVDFSILDGVRPYNGKVFTVNINVEEPRTTPAHVAQVTGGSIALDVASEPGTVLTDVQTIDNNVAHLLFQRGYVFPFGFLAFDVEDVPVGGWPV